MRISFQSERMTIWGRISFQGEEDEDMGEDIFSQ